MGKLHTLRRAIERDPDKWSKRIYYVYGHPNVLRKLDYPKRYQARSAQRTTITKQWKPGKTVNGPYAAFVMHVLKGLDMPR